MKLFRDVLGESGVLTAAADTQSYTTDWMNKYSGKRETNVHTIVPTCKTIERSIVRWCVGAGCAGTGSVVLRPKSTEQVARILKHCNARRCVVVVVAATQCCSNARALAPCYFSCRQHCGCASRRQHWARWRQCAGARRSCAFARAHEPHRVV